jgi:hypothetical protein
MEVEDALHLSHDLFSGGEDEGEVGCHTDGNNGENIENGECDWFGLH